MGWITPRCRLKVKNNRTLKELYDGNSIQPVG